MYKCIADNQVRQTDNYFVQVQIFCKPETIAVQDTVGQNNTGMFDAIGECRVTGRYIMNVDLNKENGSVKF